MILIKAYVIPKCCEVFATIFYLLKLSGATLDKLRRYSQRLAMTSETLAVNHINRCCTCYINIPANRRKIKHMESSTFGYQVYKCIRNNFQRREMRRFKKRLK